MKVVLAAVEHDLADAWEQHCGDLPNVTVHRGSILDLTVDAVVSPANSFGFMDGGIDHLYTRYFGREVQHRLQELIRTRHHGELLVGMAEIVETGHSRIPYVIAAPTMRVPMVLTDSVNPYLAARAALLLIRHGIFPEGVHSGKPVSSVINTIAFPGLGTGIGRVGPHTCAHQMRAAIEEVLVAAADYPRTWAEAQQRHQLLYTNRVRNLQRD